MPVFRVGGLASGLDTENIVKQLLDVERAPVQRYQQRIDLLQQRQNAWKDIGLRLRNLENRLADLRQASLYNLRRAASANTNVLTANATTAAAEGTYRVTVHSLALAHSLGSGAFASATDAAGVSGILTINGTAIQVDAGDSLESVRDRINAAGAGVRAEVTAVGPAAYRLLLTSTTAGSGGRILLGDDGGTGTGSVAVSEGVEGAGPTMTAAVDRPAELTAGRYRINVLQQATAHRIAADASTITATGQKVTINGREITLDGDVNDVIAAINSAGAGVWAGLEGGRLVLTATRTGAANHIQITDTDRFFRDIGLLYEDGSIKHEWVAAADARLTVNGRAVTAAQNAGITGAVAGLRLNLVGVHEVTARTALPAAPVVVTQPDGSGRQTEANDQFSIRVVRSDGTVVEETLTLTAQAYADQAALVTEISDRLAASPNLQDLVTVSLDGSDRLVFKTTGAGDRLALTGGDGGRSALGLLGFATASSLTAAADLAPDPLNAGNRTLNIALSGDVHVAAQTLTLDENQDGSIAALVDELNAQIYANASLRGRVVAAAAGDRVQLRSLDGGNVNIQVSGAAAGALSLAGGTLAAGSYDLTSVDGFQAGVSNVDVSVAGGGLLRQMGFFSNAAAATPAHLVHEAQDAVISVGGAGLTAAGNTVTIAPGLTVTLNGTGETTVTVARATEAVVTAVQALVEQFNSTMALIREKSSYDSEKKQGAILFGDATLQLLRRDLRRYLTEPVPGLSGSIRSLADIGITTGPWGTPDQDRLVLDVEKLQAQLAQDPDALALLLQGDNGAATRGYELVSRYTGSAGLADTRQQFYRRAIDDVQRRIDRMNQRLVDRERLLQRQFTALEQALRNLQSQGTALEAQLGQLMKTTSR